MAITDWNQLNHYARSFNDEKSKIIMIDEEGEEIRIDNENEFNVNIQYAREQGLKLLKFLIYVDRTVKFEGFYSLEKALSASTIFPVELFQTLRLNVLADRWFIPVKVDEPLGVCLQSAISLVQQDQWKTHPECQQFLETVVPEAFRKLQTTQSVFTWPREIHNGIFDILELLVDLITLRLRHPPVPSALLNTLAITFDTNTTFSQKHKTDPLPAHRIYALDNQEFLRSRLSPASGSFGWLRSLLQRFIAKEGLKHVRSQFDHVNKSDPIAATSEYNSLLKLFSKCHQFIETERFRAIFTESIQQAIHFLLETKKTPHRSNAQLNELNETLIEICFNYEMAAEINELLQVPPLVPVKEQSSDCYERLAEEVRSLSMIKSQPKQRIDEQVSMPLLTRAQSLCCTDDSLSSLDKHPLKRKHRREQRLLKKNRERSNTTTIQTYDRSDPADILRFFAPMRTKISGLYDDLERGTCQGKLHEVLKIEEKLKLLRPYSARFIGDQNTPDGTKMHANQIFRKNWILLNDGSMPWCNEDIQLINLSNGIEVLEQPTIPVVAPHDRALISVHFMCPANAGVYESKWILSYRRQTFGPMIWCSIEVVEPKMTLRENVPLPACFDLSKPFEPMNKSTILQPTVALSRSNSSETHAESLIDIDNESLSSASALVHSTDHEQGPSPTRLNPPLHFVDAVVTNIFSVAKQAGSTAKAIFNTLQAVENTPPREEPRIENALIHSNDLFEHLSIDLVRSNEPIDILVEMGFVDRVKNQRLLAEHQNDLDKVIEILTSENHLDFD